MNYSNLKTMIKKSKKTIKDVALAVGMTEAGFHQAIKNNTLRVSTLEDIAKYLKVSPVVFFEGTPSVSVIDVDDFFEALKSLVVDKINTKKL